MLPALGGYGEYALASSWTAKPAGVSWADAAALPASAEAAVGTLRQLRVASGETLFILGGGGSVGLIATQLALAAGVRVISATGARDEGLARELGAIPVRYGPELRAQVRTHIDVGKVDAVLDAAGKGGLDDAVALAGGPARVITLADEHAADLGGKALVKLGLIGAFRRLPHPLVEPFAPHLHVVHRPGEAEQRCHAGIARDTQKSYLASDAVPDSLTLLPPPPIEGTAAFAFGEEISRESRALRETPRGGGRSPDQRQ
jgi:hypothetical protein